MKGLRKDYFCANFLDSFIIEESRKKKTTEFQKLSFLKDLSCDYLRTELKKLIVIVSKNYCNK